MLENVIYREYYKFDDSFYAMDKYYDYENGYYINHNDKIKLYPELDSIIVFDIILPLYHVCISYQDLIKKIVYNDLEINNELLDDIYRNELFYEKWKSFFGKTTNIFKS